MHESQTGQLQPTTRDALENILDTMTDGVSYHVFLQFLIHIDQQAADGDPASNQLISMVTNFSRLIDVGRQESGIPPAAFDL